MPASSEAFAPGRGIPAQYLLFINRHIDLKCSNAPREQVHLKPRRAVRHLSQWRPRHISYDFYLIYTVKEGGRGVRIGPSFASGNHLKSYNCAYLLAHTQVALAQYVPGVKWSARWAAARTWLTFWFKRTYLSHSIFPSAVAVVVVVSILLFHFFLLLSLFLPLFVCLLWWHFYIVCARRAPQTFWHATNEIILSGLPFFCGEWTHSRTLDSDSVFDLVFGLIGLLVFLRFFCIW